MGDILQVKEDNFQTEVLESSIPVLVDFSAVWCSPCKMLEPIVIQIAEEWNGKVKVVKLDIDDNPDITIRYQVMGVPTLALFVNGNLKERITGYQPKDRIISKLSPHIG
jgi:thioredoxin 1